MNIKITQSGFWRDGATPVQKTLKNLINAGSIEFEGKIPETIYFEATKCIEHKTLGLSPIKKETEDGYRDLNGDYRGPNTYLTFYTADILALRNNRP